jgi:hypothetical protein
MTLREKLSAVYPELTHGDFLPDVGTIALQNDSDGKGGYIAKREHPTLARPTDEQLANSMPAE